MKMRKLPVIHAIVPPKSAADEIHNIHAYCANAARNRVRAQECVGGNTLLNQIRRTTVKTAVNDYRRSAKAAAKAIGGAR